MPQALSIVPILDYKVYMNVNIYLMLNLELDELQMQVEEKKGQQLEDKERAEKHAVKVT